MPAPTNSLGAPDPISGRVIHRVTRRVSRRTRLILRVGLGALAVIVALGAWVGIRAALAVNELQQAIPLATQMQQNIQAADGAAAAVAGEQLTTHADAAAGLTSDVVWRAVEFVPLLGPNLAVMRELAGTVDDVAQGGVVPLSTLASTIRLSDFKPVDGRIALQPMLDAQPAVAEAASALVRAEARVNAIDASSVVAPLAEARAKLASLVTTATSGVDALNRAVHLLPAILGEQGPRNYVVMFQNNAELRATGGIAGALALIHTDKGGFSLAQQASSGDFPKFDQPVVDLPVETRAIYGDNTAQYVQDVNFTPRFDLTGQIMREMWSKRFGLVPDGVLSIDPVALSYLLEATGPIALPSGDTLTSANAVQLLLQDVYARYSNPADQDAFFSSAASLVFDKIDNANVDPAALVKALAKAGTERRVFVWSADATEQALMEGTTLAGELPQSTEKLEKFGVYFNDATGSKMGPYLAVTISAGTAVCRNDGRANYDIKVTMANTAPLDAATRLPRYVTGAGGFGVPAGDINTTLTVYGSEGSFNLGVRRDGASVLFQPTADGNYPVSKMVFALKPGESTSLTFSFLDEKPGNKDVFVENTPFVYPIETGNLPVDCTSHVE